MTRKCKCGGTYHRTDIIKVGNYYEDTDPLVAHWRCNGPCDSKRTQRKRQPKPKKEDAS